MILPLNAIIEVEIEVGWRCSKDVVGQGGTLTFKVMLVYTRPL